MKQFDEAFRLGMTLSYDDSILLMGSCFAENIGEKLLEDQFEVNINPFGILFHPLAISNLFTRAINETLYKETDFFFFDRYYWNYEHHGMQAQTDLDAYLVASNSKLRDLKLRVESSDVIIFTFGTAWGYWIEDFLVANCHKQPQNQFEKRMSDIASIANAYRLLIQQIRLLNPKVKIIFTVSPVRHLKDGLVENSKSKAVLISSVHELCEEFSEVYYYPAYEYVVDLIRDYSNFKKDEVHLRDEVVEKIYSDFLNHNLEKDSLSVWKKWKLVQNRLKHNLLHPESDSALEFKKQLKFDLSEFLKIHPRFAKILSEKLKQLDR
jgi:hypothetical protein